MTNWLLIVFSFLAFVAAGQPAPDEVSEEFNRLRGQWRLVSEIDDGKPMPADQFVKKNILTFDATGKWVVEIDGKVVGEGTAKIDPTRKPKTIDYTFTKGENTGGRFEAIYELVGDSFRHCGVLKGTRPSEFSSKPGSGHFLVMFSREK